MDQIANEFEFKTAEQVYSSFLYKSLTHFRNIKSFHLSDLGKTSPKKHFFFWALPPTHARSNLFTLSFLKLSENDNFAST